MPGTVLPHSPRDAARPARPAPTLRAHKIEQYREAGALCGGHAGGHKLRPAPEEGAHDTTASTGKKRKVYDKHPTPEIQEKCNFFILYKRGCFTFFQTRLTFRLEALL